MYINIKYATLQWNAFKVTRYAFYKYDLKGHMRPL